MGYEGAAWLERPEREDEERPSKAIAALEIQAGHPESGYDAAGGYTMATGINRNIGMLLLAVYLILVGISGMAGLGLPPVVFSVLALLAGILILVGR